MLKNDSRVVEYDQKQHYTCCMGSLKRTLDLAQLLKSKSFFLFGPRATGKSTLIRAQLPKARLYDLLDASVFRRLLAHPRLLAEENPDPKELIVIDEIQRLPDLLNEVHRLISLEGRKFLLTGSSARKLLHGSSNLMAGRAWRADLYPLTWNEIPNFDLLRYLNQGGLPEIYLSSQPREELRAYTSLYLREEIQAESLTRNLQSFSSFLDVIALANGEEINFHSLASDCGVSVGTLKNYVQILDDTLIGFSLPGYTKTKKRKAISRIKHYLFDVGVAGSLAKRGEILPGSELFGRAFEHWIVLEVRAYLGYSRRDEELCYWRSTSKFEVDLIVGNALAIEIKSAELVQDKHLRGLRALKEEKIFKKHIVVSRDSTARATEDGIEILPWAVFLKRLWAGDLF